MSINKLIGQAEKGSKLMMQIVSSPLCQHIINKTLHDSLYWFSPKSEDNFKEYQLNHPLICLYLGIRKDKRKMFNFWPDRQPQWDGLAIGRSGTLYLFEAKSHLSETNSSCQSSSEHNRVLIYNSIREIAKNIYDIKDEKLIEEYWINNNYQIANRLTFLHKMKESASYVANYDKVKLVLLNFVNDYSLQECGKYVTEAREWTEHYDNIFSQMGINRTKAESEGVIILNYSVPFIIK